MLANAAVTNHKTFCGLKNTHLFSHSSVGQNPRQSVVLLVFRSRSYKAKIKIVRSLLYFWRVSLFSSIFKLLGQYSSTWLWDWGPHFLAGYWLTIILSFLHCSAYPLPPSYSKGSLNPHASNLSYLPFCLLSPLLFCHVFLTDSSGFLFRI